MRRCPECGRVYCVCPRKGSTGARPALAPAPPPCGHGICLGPGGCIVSRPSLQAPTTHSASPRPALVPTSTTVQVITAAGRRCECTGACGTRHPSWSGRCVSGLLGAAPLLAAPRNPTTPPHRAWQVPPRDLAAWCPRCLDGARRRHQTPPAVTAAQQLDVAEAAGWVIQLGRRDLVSARTGAR